jgi:quercetin dioxygenase-like cupin family protein
VCDKGGEPQRLNVGDIVWAPAGTVHWHGADEGSYLLHMAISHGKTTWFDAVTDEEYNKKNKST